MIFNKVDKFGFWLIDMAIVLALLLILFLPIMGDYVDLFTTIFLYIVAGFAVILATTMLIVFIWDSFKRQKGEKGND